eukprot:2456238-Rhodomonas_salina.1
MIETGIRRDDAPFEVAKREVRCMVHGLSSQGALARPCVSGDVLILCLGGIMIPDIHPQTCLLARGEDGEEGVSSPTFWTEALRQSTTAADENLTAKKLQRQPWQSKIRAQGFQKPAAGQHHV